MRPFIDLAGQRFERLLVIEYSGNNKFGFRIWKCLCDCGNITHITTAQFNGKKVRSCGCLLKETSSKLLKTHGMTKTRFHKIWKGMKSRCLNPQRNSYKNYGARGITICDRWLKFENFMQDMYKNYLEHVEEFGEKQTTIDRIDNNKGYYEENCRWTIYKEQNSNKRNNKWFKAISPDGMEYILNNQKQFAREYRLSAQSINGCLNKRRGNKTHKGWKFEYIEYEYTLDELNNARFKIEE